jgi:hypothetical protein
MSYLRPVSLTIAMLAIGCAPKTALFPQTPVAPLSVDDSLLCEHVADRFVGLPALADGGGEDQGPRPLVGRWWLRSCSMTLEKDDLRVRLQGPGWYFVDRNDGNLALHQQVPFNLSIQLDGHVSLTASDGVVAVRFAPDKEPNVALRVSGDLDVRPSSVWGSFLSVMPLISLQAKAADQFTATAEDALRLKLREGATVTYDIVAGQADATLGELGAGESPVNAFQDRVPWLINDRLSLDGAALHVVGPIEPGPTRLDVLVERGAGVTYRALCVKDMARDYSALARGDTAGLVNDARMARGTVAGQGKHTTDFRVDVCKFYLVIGAIEPTNTVVSLRVRA